MNYFPKLFQPLQVKNITLRNRIVAAPVEGIGVTKNDDIERFAILARGGASVVTIGTVSIDNERAQFITRLVYLGKADAFYLSEAAYAIDQYGAIPSVELFHSGQWGNYFPEDKIGPIDLIRDDGIKVKGMTEDDMKHIIENYSKAAAFAKKIGFKMVQLHFGHGWLPAQFLSPFFNKRKDDYGGSYESRVRFPTMILDGVRDAVGKDFPIEMRISGSEFVEGGLEIDEVTKFIKSIEDRIDLVHISAGMDKIPSAQVKMLPTIYSPHAPNIELSAAVKAEVGLPVITVGGINDPYLAESILANGNADIVALGRALIADPEFPNKARDGRVEDITPCIRCNSCFTGYVVKKNVSCSVNPRFSREHRLNNEYHHISTPKKVMVIGGGPAGMKAAISAAERGHEVTLVEKSSKLGGHLLFSDYSELRSDLRNFKNFLIYRLEFLGVKVLLETAFSKNLIFDINPDVLIIATGSNPEIPSIPGIENSNVMNVTEMYSQMKNLGNTVAIIGGDEKGCEAALILARSGHEVIIVENRSEIATDANFINRHALMTELKNQANIKILVNSTCTEFQAKRIRIKSTGKSEKSLLTDSIVYSHGFYSSNNVSIDFNELNIRTFFIGDCVKPRGIQDAIREGYHTGMQI